MIKSCHHPTDSVLTYHLPIGKQSFKTMNGSFKSLSYMNFIIYAYDIFRKSDDTGTRFWFWTRAISFHSPEVIQDSIAKYKNETKLPKFRHGSYCKSRPTKMLGIGQVKGLAVEDPQGKPVLDHKNKNRWNQLTIPLSWLLSKMQTPAGSRRERNKRRHCLVFVQIRCDLLYLLLVGISNVVSNGLLSSICWGLDS